ncbi:CooT family nickel-binding protein [Thermodesulfobacteriota bacterium]
MCEATVSLLKNGQEETILESVDLFESDGDQIRLVNIFGEERKVKAKIKSLSLVDHKILLEPVSG